LTDLVSIHYHLEIFKEALAVRMSMGLVILKKILRVIAEQLVKH
jgi:hypothetical protein